MLKHYLTSCLLLSLLLFSNCSEDEFISDSLVLTNLEAKSGGVSDTKEPVLNNVSVNGSKVTLNFTNHASPAQPEGGFELIMDGKRTKTNITDRIFSGSKNVSMSFTASNPTSHSYQIYARWNSGYKSSNELSGKGGGNAPGTPDDDNDQDLDGVKKPSNIKQPVIKSLTFNGKKVTINFVNFAAPRQPEGGYELMLDGKRTNTDITPRVNGSEQVLSMSFTLDKPDDHFYQIYARWQSGYIGSKRMYPGQATGDDGKSSPSSSPTLSMTNMKLVKAYEFEDNIGRNVTYERDGLKHQHQGRQDGQVVSVDGVGAYRFRIDPNGSTSYRHELIPRDLPSPYFKNGWEAIWDHEYVYEVRMKFSEKYELGFGWTSFFGAKNDYTTSRLGSFTLYTEGDHYFNRQYYAKHETKDRRGENRVYTYLDADGNKLTPGVDFHKAKKMGRGYPTVADDKGKWIKWTYHIKWSYNDNGFIKIYKDGKLFYTYNGSTGFKDDQGPYIKFGLYNSSWKNDKNTGSSLQESYVDYVKVYVPK